MAEVIEVMTVGFKVKFYWYHIGNDDFLFSFFSTIAYNLEGKNWGSRFPLIMNHLFKGKLTVDKIEGAIKELETIQTELARCTPESVIWDIEDLSKQPPWGKSISKDITDLSDYFITGDGNTLIAVLFDALYQAKKLGAYLEISTL